MNTLDICKRNESTIFLRFSSSVHISNKGDCYTLITIIGGLHYFLYYKTNAKAINSTALAIFDKYIAFNY